MKSLLVLAALSASVLFSSPEAFAKECKTGKACGNACIAQSATCSKDAPAPAKVCKKGKACGNACIAQDAVCSK